MTGRIQEEQTESDDEISDDKLADPSYIPEQPTEERTNQPSRTNKPTNQRSAY